MERGLAKPEWGSKRICPSCGARYYDLLRHPVICPKCSTPFDPEAFLKSRRSRPAAPVEKEIAPVGTDGLDADTEAAEADVAEEEEEGQETVPLEDGEEEDDEELLEDASELGEDEDDMAEVIENVEEEER
ncbi:MAG: TIGR02300 family protein [Stellaceae bacterium]